MKGPNLKASQTEPVKSRSVPVVKGVQHGKKIKLPKKVAGYRVPKSVRKSTLLRALLNNPMGRDVLANALTAGAGAAAAVLVENREDIAKAGKKGAKKGVQAAALAGEAAQSAVNAMIGVVRDAAHTFLPEGKQNATREGKRSPKKAAVN